MALSSFQSACTREMSLCRLRFDAFGSFGVQSPAGGVVWATSVHREWLRIAAGQRRGWQQLRQRLNPFHPAVLRLERQLYAGRRYAHVIALTDRVAGELSEHYGVPRSDMTVVPNGYASEQFNVQRREPLRREVRAELGIHPAAQVIVFVANELQRKGYYSLLEAMKLLPEPRPRLLVVGRASRAEALSAASRAGLEDDVHVVGSSNDVARYFCAADLFVMPTQYEAWGLVVVEALACGTPVVVSRCAGAAVVVRPGVTGEMLDDPRNPGEIASRILVALDRKKLDAADMSITVAQYEWTQILDQYEAIIAAHPPR
jgi:UDP-glucose:(heptosyl)LPS alpha-1,3-glucosyltransferase